MMATVLMLRRKLHENSQMLFLRGWKFLFLNNIFVCISFGSVVTLLLFATNLVVDHTCLYLLTNKVHSPR
jgi:hypothetical protein